MARRHKHEEHSNHEAWAIPYGDLITLLLAFFVVMYAISTVNESKYRVLSDSLSHAFKGPPRSITPIQIGEPSRMGQSQTTKVDIRPRLDLPPVPRRDRPESSPLTEAQALARSLEEALAPLLSEDDLDIRLVPDGVEIDVGSDVLFASGSARVGPEVDPILTTLASMLRPLPYQIRVEGHTDNLPIRTSRFPSNWELSAARAAWVVRRFFETGVEPERLSMQGYGEYRPLADNATPAGRRQNRRVSVVVDMREPPPPISKHLANGPNPAGDGL